MALVDLVASRLSKPAGRVLDTPIREVVHELLREAGYASPADVQSLRDSIRDLQSELNRVSGRANELATMLTEARGGADPRVAGLSAAMAELEARLGARIADLEAKVGAPVALARNEAQDARLAVLEERIASFPSIVESRLATIEARLTTIPAQLENRIEDLLETVKSESAEVALAPSVELSADTAAASDEVPVARPDCKVPNCDAPVRSKGFCSAHYQQWRRGTLKNFVSSEGTVHAHDKTFSVGKKFAGLLFVEMEGGISIDGESISLVG